MRTVPIGKPSSQNCLTDNIPTPRGWSPSTPPKGGHGITRDLLIGAVPPGAIGDWRYLGVSLVAGVVTFYFSPLIVRMSNAVLVFDAAGLALFAVTGSSKALSFGLNPVMATVLGMVTGIGGGMVRDVLLAEIPTVLRADLYAVAALAAAAIVVIGHMLQLPVAAVTTVALISCFLLRIMAISRGWRLPVAKAAERQDLGVQKEDSKAALGALRCVAVIAPLMLHGEVWNDKDSCRPIDPDNC